MRHWYTNGETNKLINDGDNIPEGYYKGIKLRFVDKTKLATAIGKKWYNNGTNELYLKDSDVVPEGYVLGRLKRICITNGERETRIFPYEDIPEGWYRGMSDIHNKRSAETLVKNNYRGERSAHWGIPRSEEVKRKISESESGSKHWAYGTKHSEETKRKQSEGLRNYYKNNTISDETRHKMSLTALNMSKETKDKMSESAINRIIKNGFSCKGKSGWYKGYHCMSSWELAYVIYNIEHNIAFEQNKEWFKYEYNGSTHRYLPDFIENGVYIEIKGWVDERVSSKIEQFPRDLRLKIMDRDDMQPYINYAVNKYGTDFTKLYEIYEVSK